MSRLLEYFNVIDKNAVARAAHYASPIDSMNTFGLSTEEQMAVLSGDQENLAQAAGLDAEGFPIVHIPLSVFPESQLAYGTRV